MKLLISGDIEGTCGINTWDETGPNRDAFWYDYFRKQMTREVAAACEGALAAGANDIIVKDAHATARNIIPSGLPREVRMSRGWAGDGFGMVTGIQNGVEALAFTGYHCAAFTTGNPMSHTSNLTIEELTINGLRTSEFVFYSYAAGMLGVPIVFLSGDAEICAQAEELVPGIVTVPVVEGFGNSTVSPHPDVAAERIREGMERALKGDWQSCRIKMPERFEVVLRYTTHAKANSMSLYPGAARIDAKTIGFKTDNYMDVLRFYSFVS